MKPYDIHVFVCMNRRDPSDPRGCCAEKGSEAIRDYFKTAVKARGVPGRVRFRRAFWNAPSTVQALLYAGALAAVAIFAYGVWQRIRLWRRGTPEQRFDRIGERLWLVATHALGQARTLSQTYPGIMHATM